MAAMGHEVRLLERVPTVQESLREGLEALAKHPIFAPLAEQLHLVEGDAISLLPGIIADVVYLDPMYPDSTPKSLPQAAIRELRAMAGDDTDAELLLPAAVQAATHHVVVKRPRHAPSLGTKPDWQLSGASTRFDCYTVRNVATTGV
jgi:16S rRNA (guanine1516-N2)-methyltransferase